MVVTELVADEVHVEFTRSEPSPDMVNDPTFVNVDSSPGTTMSRRSDDADVTQVQSPRLTIVADAPKSIDTSSSSTDPRLVSTPSTVLAMVSGPGSSTNTSEAPSSMVKSPCSMPSMTCAVPAKVTASSTWSVPEITWSPAVVTASAGNARTASRSTTTSVSPSAAGSNTKRPAAASMRESLPST